MKNPSATTASNKIVIVHSERGPSSLRNIIYYDDCRSRTYLNVRKKKKKNKLPRKITSRRRRKSIFFVTESIVFLRSPSGDVFFFFRTQRFNSPPTVGEPPVRALRRTFANRERRRKNVSVGECS